MNLKELIKLLPTGCSNFSMGSETDSFYVCSEGHDFYVEPEFETVFAEDSQPSVIFISAVGASGKTALAEKLSFETGAPIFNLAKNRNVGDGTLKKTLMECYEEEVFNVQRALKSGKQCIIIDALDEGRSKVNEKSFETFLDDIIGLCDAGDSGVSFILLGRTKVLEDSCLYLESRDISTNVFGIKAFSMEKIKEYIDKSCKKNNSAVDSNYIDCRDELISKMTTSFKQGLDDESNVFLNFLGYPPVLDSIATTLLRENNYFAFYKELKSAEGYGSEKNMLVGISRHILKREQFDKVKNNIVDSIGYEDGKRCSYDFDGVYSEQEQCLRLLYYVLGKDFNIQIIPDEELNAKYEEQLKEFFVEHPFLAGKSFRNPVFEAFVLARLMAAPHPYTELFDDFFESHKSTYHLLHMYKALNDGTTTDTKAYLPFLIRSSQELRSARIIPTLSIKGDSWEEAEAEAEAEAELEDKEQRILFTVGAINKGDSVSEERTVLEFELPVSITDVLDLGSMLSYTTIDVPCSVSIKSVSEVEINSPVSIAAKDIKISSPTIMISNSKDLIEGDLDLYTRSRNVVFESQGINCFGEKFLLNYTDTGSVAYPLSKYLEKIDKDEVEPDIQKKIFRIYRILREFRSHSKGSLAKFVDKIRHKRVLRGDGKIILEKLLSDKIIYEDKPKRMYHIDSENLSEHLGVSWNEIRSGVATEPLKNYLKKIA